MNNKSFTVSLIILVATIISVFAIASREQQVVVKTNLGGLPMEIMGYKGTEDVLPDSVSKELNADKYIYRSYRSNEGEGVDLYIGYYGTAKSGRTWHNPTVCVPAFGWGIIKSHKVSLNTKTHPNGIKVNCILARKGNLYRTLFHWYQSDGNKVLATEIEQNIQRFFGRILDNRNDGATIQISAFSDENGVEESFLLVKSFAEKVMELLPRYWPVEKKTRLSSGSDSVGKTSMDSCYSEHLLSGIVYRWHLYKSIESS